MLHGSWLYRWLMGIGALILILGMIHIAYTPILYKEIVSLPMGLDNLYTFLFMFVATGVSLVLSGVLAVYSIGGLKENERWAWVVSLAIGVYVLLLGAGAVVTMQGDNPFAYIMLVLAVLEMFILLLTKRSFEGTAEREEKL